MLFYPFYKEAGYQSLIWVQIIILQFTVVTIQYRKTYFCAVNKKMNPLLYIVSEQLEYICCDVRSEFK